MKILTRKKQDEILKRLATNEIIAVPCLKHEDAEKFIDNSENIIYSIGGIEGLSKVIGIIRKWIKEYESE